MRARLRNLGDRYNAFIAHNEIAWELTMAVLAVVFVVVGFAGDDAPAETAQMLDVLDLGLTVLFALEFGTRFLAARSRRAYLRGHWIDLLALVPTARSARLLRLLRLLRLVRAFSGVFRALASIERVATQRSLILLFTSWLGVAVIAATGLYLAEVGVNPNIDDPTDALWWAVVTLTTVGYGDVFPVTPEGRLAGAGLMIVGITLFAAVTATITSGIIKSQDGPTDSPDVGAKLRMLQGLLVGLLRFLP